MAFERQALLVVGMHRSGTSALTRVLNIYGAALSPDLLPANSGNVTGFWESAAVVRFHDRLLKTLGSPWDHPVWFSRESPDVETAREHARQLAALVEAQFGNAPLLVVKDPRLCRLLPIWQEGLALLGIEPVVILFLRHPAEVAASLHRRDGMPERAALLLWLQYVLAAEHDSRPLKRALLFYDRLLTDPVAAIEGIQSQLGMTLPARSAAADAKTAAFVEPSLRHERALLVPTQSCDTLSRWVQTVYAWFERAGGPKVPADSTDLDAVRTELTDAEVVFGPSLQWLRRREQRRRAQLGALAEWLRQIGATKYWRARAWLHRHTSRRTSQL